jgi:hypothetical protein
MRINTCVCVRINGWTTYVSGRTLSCTVFVNRRYAANFYRPEKLSLLKVFHFLKLLGNGDFNNINSSA